MESNSVISPDPRGYSLVDQISSELTEYSKKRKFDELPQYQPGYLINRWTDFYCPSDRNDYDFKLPFVLLDKIEYYPKSTFWQGRELLEVFSVVIENNDAKPRHLHGTIEANREGGFTPLKIWDQLDDDPITIKANESTSLLLNGPFKCYSADDPFLIYLDLIDKGTGEKFKEIFGCRATRVLRPRSETVDCGNLSVTVKFAVYDWAVPATVEVSLVKCHAPTKVRGCITARSSCFPKSSGCESLLFNRQPGEDVETISEVVVPLSRSVVAVPGKSSLEVSAQLFGGDGKEIASGMEEFPVVSYGIAEKNICGKYGEICVKVTWKLYPVIRS